MPVCMCCVNPRQALQNCGNRKCTYRVCWVCIQEMHVHFSTPLQCPQCRQVANYGAVTRPPVESPVRSLVCDYFACGAAYWVWGYVTWQLLFPVYSFDPVHQVLLGVAGCTMLTVVTVVTSFLIHFGELVSELY